MSYYIEKGYHSITAMWYIVHGSSEWLAANAQDYYVEGPHVAYLDNKVGNKQVAGTIRFKHEADLTAFIIAHDL